MDLLLVTQYFDMLKEVGLHGKQQNTVTFIHSFIHSGRMSSFLLVVSTHSLTRPPYHRIPSLITGLHLPWSHGCQVIARRAAGNVCRDESALQWLTHVGTTSLSNWSIILSLCWYKQAKISNQTCREPYHKKEINVPRKTATIAMRLLLIRSYRIFIIVCM